MSKWSEHVKKFAKKHKMTYRLASMNSKCKESYRRKKNTSPKRMNGVGFSRQSLEEVPDLEDQLKKRYFDKERAQEAIEYLGGPEGVLGKKFVDQGKKLRGGKVEFDDVQGCIALILAEYIEKFGHNPPKKTIEIIRTNAASICGSIKQLETYKKYMDEGVLPEDEGNQQIQLLKDRIYLTLSGMDNQIDIETAGGGRRVSEGVREALSSEFMND